MPFFDKELAAKYSSHKCHTTNSMSLDIPISSNSTFYRPPTNSVYDKTLFKHCMSYSGKGILYL